MPTPKTDTPTAVYRLFDHDGNLLYVGCSYAPAKRCKAHAQEKPWWPEVASRTDEWFAQLAEARSAERSAIETERPRYNVQGSRLTQRITAPKSGMTLDECIAWVRTWPKWTLRRQNYHPICAPPEMIDTARETVLAERADQSLSRRVPDLATGSR